ncbi:MAG: hypothetical protein QOK65_11175 [Nitrososphaeraceae archaeon]|nr:hypothetical protein [Nitrososphaeraceae archaeon]
MASALLCSKGLETISSLFSISFEYISLLITLGGGHAHFDDEM